MGDRVDVLPRFQNFDEFRRANPLRGCRSFDFGVVWHDNASTASYWSLTWLEATGEVVCRDMAKKGPIIVLADRLRRPVVELLLKGDPCDRSLWWAVNAVIVPFVPDGFSGYVSQPEKRTVWVVRNGWLERPLTMRSTSCSFVPPEDVRQLHLRRLADSLLIDHLEQHADIRVTSTAIGADWDDLSEFAIATDEISRWLRIACLEEIRFRGSMATRGERFRNSTYALPGHQSERIRRCQHGRG